MGQAASLPLRTGASYASEWGGRWGIVTVSRDPVAQPTV